MSSAATEHMSQGQQRRRAREAAIKHIGVDPMCFDLADHFLRDSIATEGRGPGEIEQDRRSLSQAIQTGIIYLIP